MKERKDGAQAFRGNLPIQLVKKDAGVALKVSEPDIKLEGQDALMTNANVHLAKTHINQKVYAALQSAIDRIWRVEKDIRFLLSLQRDMQTSFARKAAQLLGQTKDAILKQAEQSPSCTPIQGLKPTRGMSSREIGSA